MTVSVEVLIIIAVTAFVLGAAAWELTRDLIERHERRKADERLDAWERMRR